MQSSKHNPEEEKPKKQQLTQLKETSWSQTREKQGEIRRLVETVLRVFGNTEVI